VKDFCQCGLARLVEVIILQGVGWRGGWCWWWSIAFWGRQW
jgi:hypothetical protein